MKKRIFNLILMLFFGAFSCFSQQIEKPQFVASTEGIKEYSLSNGMKVLLIPDASQSNTVVNIVYLVGSKHEGYGETGMAHLLEHMLFKSTKNLGDIKTMLSEKSTSANGTTYYDRTNYYEMFPYSEENLAWSLEMEADRMINATLLQEDLDKEFSVVRNEFEIGENNPSGVLRQKIISAAYMWHNYGRSTIGSKEDVERVKVTQLRRFYEKYYQPDNAILLVGGKFDEEKTLEYIGKYFASIPRPERVLEEIFTVEPAQEGEKYVEVRRSGEVPLLAYAYHTCSFADKDYAALEALCHILTTDPSGYLYKALVETRNLNSIYAYPSALRDAGLLYIGANFSKDKDIEDVNKLVRAELDKIPTLDYSEEDLQRAKTSLLNRVENIKNNTIGLTISLTEIISSGDYRLGFLYRDNVENLTIDDIKRVAKRYFRSNNLTYGAFIPSADEERVKPDEFKNEDIRNLVAGYVGKAETQTKEFEASIDNLKKHYAHGKLSNGMKFGCIDKEIKGEKVVALFSFPVSNEKELAGKAEIASCMSQLMLGSGTKNMSKEQIVDKLRLLKSSVNFGWSGQSLILYINSYKEHFEEAMALVKTLLTESIFPEHELNKLIENTLTRYESLRTDPQFLARQELTQLTKNYPKSSLFYSPSIDESIANYKKVTRNDIVEFYSNIMGANNGLGTIIGLSDKKYVEDLLENTFGKWNSKSKYIKAMPTFFATKKLDKIVNISDKENANANGAIAVEINVKDKDYPALLMANAMLGSGGFLSARIPMRLREAEGISYGAGSGFNAPIDNKVGVFSFFAMLNPTMRDKVEEALKDEIAKALKDGFTQKELTDNIASWENGKKAALANDWTLIELSSNLLEYGIAFDEWDNLIDKVKKLKLKEVNDAFRKYVSLDKLTMVYAGDFDEK